MSVAKNRRLLAALLVLTGALALARPARADQVSVYQKTLPSTGFVVTTNKDKSLGYGTCWVVDTEKRLVITNQHVVLGHDTCKVTFPRFSNGNVLTNSGLYAQSDYIPGKVLARDSKRDLALVRLDPPAQGVKAL